MLWEGKGQLTMMLGSATFLYDYLKKNYADFNVIIIKSKPQWQIRFSFSRTSIDVYKRLLYKKQWMDNYAYQKPESYRLAYGFDQEDKRLNKALSVLHFYYSQSNISYQTDIDHGLLEFDVIEIEKNQNDFASLYFYSPSSLYISFYVGNYDLKRNDSTIYELRKDKPAMVKVKNDGDYTLSAKTSERTDIKLNIEKGRSYFIRCGIDKSSFLGKPKIHLVIQEYGKPEYWACVERSKKKQNK